MISLCFFFYVYNYFVLNFGFLKDHKIILFFTNEIPSNITLCNWYFKNTIRFNEEIKVYRYTVNNVINDMLSVLQKGEIIVYDSGSYRIKRSF